ncbi:MULTISPECIES: Rieske 2Fe-2S domain-containing protein [unclassified Streptomyces]|uniref:Rieske 2Fe-2S domain-containing protein n=1 Tax=unclassified Streptomyces TaxID=2593676 RepID=UPI00382366ED
MLTTTTQGTAGGVLPHAMDTLEGATWLDGPAGVVRKAVRALPLSRGRDVLRGLWLGHPLHPVLVQVPIGAWSSAGILDLLPGESRAARRLVAVGLVAAGPAALAGWVDWAEQRPRQARVGLVHAVANLAAVTAYAGSLTARLTGRPFLGKALGFGGMAVATVGGVLGGHLAYRQGAGVNHAEAVPVLVEPGWHRIGMPYEFPVGEPVRRMADEVAVVVVHGDDGRFYALADRCSHMDGPLHEGKILEGCLECPWHGSRFRLTDGENVQGPATAPQPRFDCRISSDGQVEVRVAQR